MGDSLVAWRVRIGRFAGRFRNSQIHIYAFTTGSCVKTAVFLSFLLLIGGIEPNPEPSIDDVFRLVSESKVTMDNNFKEINEKITKVETTINEKFAAHERQILVLEEENLKLRECLKNLENKRDELENRSRRDNLVFHGKADKMVDLNESWDDCKNKILEVIRERMELDGVKEEDITRAHRLGHRRGSRPIIVKFANISIGEKVLSARKKLKNTNIFINEDYSVRVRQERGFLLEEMKAARERGSKATVSFNKLRVDGRWFKYSWEEEKIVELGAREQPRELQEPSASQQPQQQTKVVTRGERRKAQDEDEAARQGLDKWLRQRPGGSNSTPRGRGGRGGRGGR